MELPLHILIIILQIHVILCPVGSTVSFPGIGKAKHINRPMASDFQKLWAIL